MSYQEQIQEQLTRAQWSNDNFEKEKNLEKAVQMAEFHKDFDLMLSTKIAYVRCVVEEGYHEKALPQFAWLLAQIDTNSEKIEIWDKHIILWYYKWMIDTLPNYTNIGLPQIFGALQDMEKRFIDFDGENIKAINDFKRRVYTELGELEKAEIYYKEFLKYDYKGRSLSSLSDCEACMCDSEVAFFLSKNDIHKAIELGNDILVTGKGCRGVPRSTHAKLCMSYTLIDDLISAERHLNSGLSKLPTSENHLTEWHYYMFFLAKTQKYRKALSLFNKVFFHTQKTLKQSSIFEFYIASLYLFESYKKDFPKKSTVKLTIEDNPTIYSETGVYNLDTLIAVFKQKVNEIAEMFDNRNQNKYFSNRITQFYGQL